MKTNSGKIAFCGIISAVSIVIMFLGAILPFTEYALPAISGLFLVPIVIEVSKKYAWTTYAATSIVSLIILPNKEIAVLFILFFGFYPILKSYFENIHHKIAEWLCKLGVFNFTMIAVFWISTKILGIPAEEYTIGGIYMPWIFLLAGNFMFLLYDICLTKMIHMYIHVLRKKLLSKFHF